MNETEGQYAKRRKLTSRTKSRLDCEENVLIHPNSLTAMPEHIIDAIFDFLDLASRKSLSETCKRFNSIFSHPRNLNKVWLNFGDQCSLPLLKSSRTYPNLILNKTLPASVLQHLSSQNLKALKVEFEKFKCSPLQSAELTFIDAISHFTKLTHLEALSPPYDDVTFEDLKNNPNKAKYPRLELKHLEYLKIDGKFFTILFEYNIQFTSEKLRKIIFVNWPNVKNVENKIKSFIAKQRDLRALSLNVYSRFFESPPLIVNSKLREFELKNSMEFGDLSKSESAQNFLNFIKSQDELEVLTLPNVSFAVKDCQQMKQLREKLIDLKLKRSIQINYFPDIGTAQKSSLKSVDVLNADIFTGRPNLAVEKLKITIHCAFSFEKSKVFSLIAHKFPNLKRIDISNGGSDCKFPQLSDCLKNISELHIDSFVSTKTITIPKIRCLGFKISNYIADRKMQSQIHQLLVRHDTIEKLIIKGISMTPRKDEEINCLVKLVEFALVNLKSLKLISVEEVIYYRQHKVDKWQEVTIKSIGRLMIKHAQSGFHFFSRGRDSDGVDILKRDDTKVVWQKEGRWNLL